MIAALGAGTHTGLGDMSDGKAEAPRRLGVEVDVGMGVDNGADIRGLVA
ncbi:hypothetical protein [Limimaricola soesokkakensis]|nr:hypothetical protein [Limimaricola soesokkakensis]